MRLFRTDALRAVPVPAGGRLLIYVTAVGVTRLLFGAHFPLDVLVGAALGHRCVPCAAALVARARLLPLAGQPGVPVPVGALNRPCDARA